MKSIIITILLTISFQSFSQKLDDQFSSLMEDTETFKEFKVIKIETLRTFWNGVSDSIQMKDEKIVDLKDQSDLQNNKVNELSNELNEAKFQIEELNNHVTSISVLGAQIDKTVYKVINFVAISTLLIIIGFILYKLKERINTAQRKINDYSSLENKFEDYRKKSLEDQMKLRRELQTERNKLNDLKIV